MKTKNLESGQAMMIAIILFLFISVTVILGLVGPVIREHRIISQILNSRQSYFLAEAGLEDVSYRLLTGQLVDASETLTLNGQSVTTLTADTAGGKEVVSTAESSDSVRSLKSELLIGEGATFHYGIQIGNGGFTLAQNAGVNGNIYSNGSVTGQNGSFVTGSVYAVSGISGLSRIGVQASSTGDANAPSVTNSTVYGTLHCDSGSGNNKVCDNSGTRPTSSPMPVSDQDIQNWKDDALAGGVVGTQSLSGSGNIMGPKKINGNLTVGNGAILKLTGVLWVTGNILLDNNSKVVLDASFGEEDGVIVADGTITMNNGSKLLGSGTAGSYIMALTTSTSATAIKLLNGTDAGILVAPYGTVEINNNADLNQVTAKTVALMNNVYINYLQGIIEATFVSGPSGGYSIESWSEVE